MCVTPGSSSSGELLLSLSDGPAASPGSTAGETTTALVSVHVGKAKNAPVSVSEYQGGNNC